MSKSESSKSDRTSKVRTQFYGVWHGDHTEYFGPFETEEAADEATYEESLRSGYDGAASEVITADEYRNRKRA